MDRLAEFIQHHPFLVTVVIVLAVAAIAFELRHRMRGASALSPAEAVRLINAGALVVDVRDADSFLKGHIIDARNIAESQLKDEADGLKKYREKPVLLYCETGGPSAAAARLMKSLGFMKVVNLQGGLAAWKQENLPTVAATAKPSGKGKGGQK